MLYIVQIGPKENPMMILVFKINSLCHELSWWFLRWRSGHAEHSPFTSEVASSSLSENVLGVTRTQCSTHVKRVGQHTDESRGFSPGTPVSSHREVDRVG